MTCYKKITPKIDHPWWHWFFTSLYSYGNDGSCERHYCSKCNLVYVFQAEEIEEVYVDEN